MRIAIIILAVLSSSSRLQAQQNLVPNSSFEYLDTCLSGWNQLANAVPWFQPQTCYGLSGSSDIWNSCTNQIGMGNPFNGAGFQFPRIGNGYAGIGVFNSMEPNKYREYIEIKLISSLISNKKYNIFFYVSLASSYQSDCGASGIGLVLSIDSIIACNIDFDAIDFDAQIKYSDTIPIMDTTNWVLIQGEYTAQGGEQFITIGNFLDGDLVVYDTTGLPQNNLLGCGAYYYIDDVSVTEIDSSIGIPEPIQTNCKFYQTDAQKWIVESTGKPSKLNIYNSIGKMVYEYIPKQNKETIELSLAGGIYYWQAGISRGKILVK